jgi:exonuclease VII small subunit
MWCRRRAEAVVAELEAGVCKLESGAAAAQSSLHDFMTQHKAQLQGASKAITDMLQQQVRLTD